MLYMYIIFPADKNKLETAIQESLACLSVHLIHVHVCRCHSLPRSRGEGRCMMCIEPKGEANAKVAAPLGETQPLAHEMGCAEEC